MATDEPIEFESEVDPEAVVEALEHDAKISEIFYYFAEHTDIASGRTMGRKIGVVQEILLLQYFRTQPKLLEALYLEHWLEGESTARHKVEFSWFDHVAVEVGPGDEIPHVDDLRFVGPGTDNRCRFGFGSSTTQIKQGATGAAASAGLRAHLQDQHRDFRVLSQDADGVRLCVINTSALLASVESKRVGAQRFASSDKLGSGIQTIEKAKQASLVAIDLDLKYNETLKCLAEEDAERTCINGVVLGNGVHWTDKDRNVLRTYTDFVYLVRDEAIIRYADYVRAKSDELGESFLDYFMSYFSGLTKFEADSFEVSDHDLQAITPEENTTSLGMLLTEHLEQHAGHTF